MEKDPECKSASDTKRPSITKEALKRSKDRHEAHHFITKFDDKRHGVMRRQRQNDYAKDAEKSSGPENLAEACNLTIRWEGNKKSWNRTDRIRDGRLVHFYKNGGRGRRNNNKYDRRGRGNNNRDRDNNNNNNESNSDPNETLCHGESHYGRCINPNCTSPNSDNRNSRNTNNANIESSNNENYDNNN